MKKKILFAMAALAFPQEQAQLPDFSFLWQPQAVLVQTRQPIEWVSMLENVKRFEGFFAEPYRCPAGVVTVGYGHTAKNGLQRNLTQSDAHKLLVNDLKIAKEHVKRIVKVPLTDSQEAALVSFTFNCGQGNLARLVNGPDRLNAGNYNSVERLLPLYRKANGRILKGLEKRRKYELTLWRSGDTLLASK